MAAKPKPEQQDENRQAYREQQERNLQAYREQQAELEAKHRGEYVAVAGGRVVGVYPDFEAACAAVEQDRMKLVFQIGDRPDLGPIRLSSPIRKLGTLRQHGG
jgi:hypothetical protein